MNRNERGRAGGLDVDGGTLQVELEGDPGWQKISIIADVADIAGLTA